jgi:LmbE family N-acetylglucosaminyl deacetylase
MKRLLAIFAHPDDEGAIAGTMARYARDGARVALVCATGGEAGEISDPSLATPENLGEVREAELRCACDTIGIEELYLLDFCDSGMIGTPENDLFTAFIQADPDEVKFKLVHALREFKPHVVVTFEPNGWYGHPDHIAAGRYASEAYALAGDPAAYPDAGEPWQPQRLFHAAMPRSMFKTIVDYAREHKLDAGGFDQIPFDEPDPLESQITHVLDVEAFFDVKETSMHCHRTQFGEENPFRSLPRQVVRTAMAREHFIQVDPPAPNGSVCGNDLFEGL